MKKEFRILIFSLALLLTSSCDKPNNLTEFSSTESDEALYFEAKKAMNSSNWEGAIDIMTNQMSATYRARSEVKESLMHAYGGQCGISFFDFINNLKSVSSSKMFEFSLQMFGGRVVNQEACDSAVDTLISLGATAASRTTNQNVFAAILGLTRMSTTLHAKFDQEFSGLGNGVVDAGWDSCNTADTAQTLSDEEMNRVVTGAALIFENLAVLGDQLTSGSAGGAFDAAKTLCEASVIGDPDQYGAPGGTAWSDITGIPADFAEPLNCLNVDTSLVTDKMRRIYRRLISSSTMGFGTCDLSDVDASITGPPFAVTFSSNCCPALVTP